MKEGAPTPPSPESREARIDALIEKLAGSEGMSFDDIESDLITFGEYEGNDGANPEYMKEVAEKLGVTVKELNEYAAARAAAQKNSP